MAGRHGVPDPERRSHARVARRQRRRRLQRRDAAQPWLWWLAFRLVLGLVVVAAGTWSFLLVRRGQGGYWPIIAVAAGVLSLLLIGLDIAARRRQRAALRVPSVARLTGPDGTNPGRVAEALAPTIPAAREYRGSHHYEAPAAGDQAAQPHEPWAGQPAEPAPRPGRHAHRR
jgi:hypothetical protein